MRAILIAVALAMPTQAFADSEARQGADWVRISALPCKNEKVLALIQAAGEDGKDYRAARAEFAGAPYTPCWKPIFEREVVYMIYEDGDKGLIPFRDFKPVQEV